MSDVYNADRDENLVHPKSNGTVCFSATGRFAMDVTGLNFLPHPWKWKSGSRQDEFYLYKLGNFPLPFLWEKGLGIWNSTKQKASKFYVCRLSCSKTTLFQVRFFVFRSNLGLCKQKVLQYHIHLGNRLHDSISNLSKPGPRPIKRVSNNTKCWANKNLDLRLFGGWKKQQISGQMK